MRMVFAFLPSFLKTMVGFSVGLKSIFYFISKPLFCIWVAMSSAMAGAAVMPGDCMPAAWIRPLVMVDALTIKSSVSARALRPENSVMTVFNGMLGNKLRAFSMI